VGNPNSIEDQVDLPQTLDLYNWLDDLCQIKDAFGVEAGYVCLLCPISAPLMLYPSNTVIF
jgi:hypothetical protein